MSFFVALCVRSLLKYSKFVPVKIVNSHLQRINQSVMKSQSAHINLRLLMAAILVLSLTLSSCHFGNVDDVRPNYGNDERDITFSFLVNHEFPTDDLALFGTCFVGGKDTVKTIGKDDQVIAEVRDVPARVGHVLLNEEENAEYNFEAQIPARLANNSETEVALFYPYRTVRRVQADTSAVRLDFGGQDGSSYTAMQICDYRSTTATVQCGEAAKGHAVCPDKLTLERKYAMLYFSLVSYDGTKTFADYLRQQAMAYGTGFSVTSIRVSDYETPTNFGDASLLNPLTGEVTLAPRCNRYVELRQLDGLDMLNYQLQEIPMQYPFELGGDRIWGTHGCVCFPCEGGKLPLSLRIAITCQLLGRTQTFYAHLRSGYEYSEGEVYFSSSLRCFANEEDIQPYFEGNVYRAEE